MKKYIEAIIILFLVAAFGVFSYNTKQTNTVLSYASPDKLNIDINNNGMVDFGEQICIPNTETFNLDIKPDKPSFAKELNTNTLIAMGYLADEFVRKNVLLKKVKVKFTGNKTPDCRYAEVYIDGTNYADILYNSGFASVNNKVSTDKYKNNLARAENLKLLLLNRKSNKYHKLDCEYGTQSGDYVILKNTQLPKDAVKCSYCLGRGQKHKNINKQPVITSQSSKNYEITSGKIRFILTDFTTHLKPNRDCSTKACIELLSEINKAQISIDMAIYGYDRIPKITEAITKAKNRGVKFRYIYDSVPKADKNYYQDNEELIKLADKTSTDFYSKHAETTSKIMHNKFIIFDNKTVYTGSMNLSPTGLSDFNANTIIILNSPKIANLYTAEFEQMLNGKFHEYKRQIDLNRDFELNDSKVSVYFSPADHTSDYIIKLIECAQKYIYIPTFVLTHSEITKSLFRAKDRGVDVKIIIDANGRTTLHTKYNELKEHKIPVKTEIFAGKMHSKTMIIDDKYIITGSMNFSNSGETRNDENSLIIESPAISKYYKEFFLRLWKTIPDYWLEHAAAAESRDSVGSCTDGIDNDYDGLIDNLDSGCFER